MGKSQIESLVANPSRFHKRFKSLVSNQIANLLPRISNRQNVSIFNIKINEKLKQILLIF